MANVGSAIQTKNEHKTKSGDDPCDLELQRREKRRQQHQHWMKVMMEGQATPDLSYQKSELPKH